MRSRGEGEIGGEIDAIVRRAARSTRGAIDERARLTIALLVNRAARRLTSDSLAIAIDEGCDQRARSSDDRIACRLTSGAIAGEVSSSSLSLSDLGSLFSLSLFLSLSLSF